MKNLFTIMILQLFLVIGCKNKSLNDDSMTPNQLEHQVKNGEREYNMNGEKVLNNESDPQSFKDFEESILNKDQSTKNDDNVSNDNDFEYSEFWRKEAYLNTKKFLIEVLKTNKPSCKVIGQGYYQPGLVKYLGGQGYRVRVLCEFDCNQNYINEKYFWVEAYYLGNNNWSMDIVDQKFND